MHRHARSGNRLAAAATAGALLVSGVALTPLLTTGTAVAAPLPAWQKPADVGPTGLFGTFRAATASDGTGVAAWWQTLGTGHTLHVATRPPGNDRWGPARKLATVPQAGSDTLLRLVPGADGRVTALWVEYPSDRGDGATGPARLRSAVLAGGTWSAPAEVLPAAAGRALGAVELATGPHGTATAVWSSRPVAGGDWRISVADRAADGTWSAPVTVASDGPTGTVSGADLAVDGRGEATVALLRTSAPATAERQALAAVETVTRPTPSAAWGAPEARTAQQATTRAPRIAAGPSGLLALTWTTGQEDDDATTAVWGSLRPAGSATWGKALPVPLSGSEGQVPAPEPLIAPDGDVTVVWRDWRDAGDHVDSGHRTSTLRSGATAWTDKKTLHGGGGDEGVADASIGPDGTVHVVWEEWTEVLPSSWNNAVVHAARTSADDTWSEPRPVPGASDIGVVPVVGAGPAGSATLLYSEDHGEEYRTLRAVRADGEAGLRIGSSAVPSTAPLAGSDGRKTVWAPVWKLTRPAAHWAVTLTDRAGKTVTTLKGGAGSTIAAAWKGRTADGGLPANGPLTWTLTGTGSQAPAPVALGSGTVTVTGGAAVRRDLGSRTGTPDGTGD
ncbi:hypothetical protein ABTZ17_35275, partial [Streptomyces sp. NPDC097619]